MLQHLNLFVVVSLEAQVRKLQEQKRAPSPVAASTQLPSLSKKQELGEENQELGEQKQEFRKENQEDGCQERGHEGRKRKASDSEAERQNRSKVFSRYTQIFAKQLKCLNLPNPPTHRRGASSRPAPPGPTDASFVPETLPVVTEERRCLPAPDCVTSLFQAVSWTCRSTQAST